jgi:hypothetical protein
VEAVELSVVVLGAAHLPSAASAAVRPSSSWHSRIFGCPGWSRPLHLVDGASLLTWCVGTPVPRLRRRRAGASSSGGVELGWWCVGGRSGVCRGSLLVSPSLEADGGWCSGLRRVPAERVQRSRFRHRVADGFCGFFHAWRCSRVKVSWGFGFFVSGVGSTVAPCSYASCVCCNGSFESLYSVSV